MVVLKDTRVPHSGVTDGARIKFGQFIRRLRRKEKITQYELARECNVTGPHISQIELGRQLPTDNLCVELARKLNYDPGKLIRKVQAVRSPTAAKVLFGEKRASQHPRDPDLAELQAKITELQERLEELGESLSREELTKLLETIRFLMQPYDSSVER